METISIIISTKLKLVVVAKYLLVTDSISQKNS